MEERTQKAINMDVAQIRQMIGNENKITDIFWKVQDKLLGAFDNIDPDKRTRADLIDAIAMLEETAGMLRDEISDGAYNEK